MISPEQQITHPGEVIRLEGGKVYVRIASQASCGSCSVRSHCGMAEIEDKVVEVTSPEDTLYKPGQRVEVSLERSLGFRALLYGYLYPFIILLFGIILMLAITSNELVSALVGIGLMVPYYGWVYLIRERLRNRFQFRIKV